MKGNPGPRTSHRAYTGWRAQLDRDRYSAGLTWSDLARLARVGRRTLFDIMNGSRPHGRTRFRIQTALTDRLVRLNTQRYRRDR